MTQPQCWFPARWRDNSPPSKLQMWAPTCQRSSRTANKSMICEVKLMICPNKTHVILELKWILRIVIYEYIYHCYKDFMCTCSVLTVINCIFLLDFILILYEYIKLQCKIKIKGTNHIFQKYFYIDYWWQRVTDCRLCLINYKETSHITIVSPKNLKVNSFVIPSDLSSVFSINFVL